MDRDFTRVLCKFSVLNVLSSNEKEKLITHILWSEKGMPALSSVVPTGTG
jgi:hypothetical protein